MNKVKLFSGMAVILVAATVGTLSFFTSVGSVEADEGHGTLQGSYGWYGFATPQSVIAGVAIGRMTFDRDGSCSMSLTLNLEAHPEVATVTSSICSYELHPDGTGSFGVVLGPPFEGPPFNGAFLFHFVLVEKGREFFLIHNEAGILNVGIAKRQ